MSTPLVSLPESMFGERAARWNYLALTTRPGWYKMADGREFHGRLFKSPPTSLLEVPPREVRWGNDYSLDPSDFLPRGLAFHLAAQKNAKSLLDPFDDGTPAKWTCVFRLGGWEEGSYLTWWDADGSKCHVTIDSSISLVRPTKEEVKRYGSAALEEVGAPA